MTAAVITGGAGPALIDIKDLLDECDLLVAADSGLEKMMGWGRTPHLVVGDGDSLRPEHTAAARVSGWIPAPRDKDFTDTELALQVCTARGADAIHLIGGGEGRMDHLLANLLLFRQFPALQSWSTARESCRVLSPGAHTTNHPPDSVLSVYPLDLEGKIETRGLVWELGPVDFTRLMSLSNRPRTGPVEWQVQKGRFLLMVNHG